METTEAVTPASETSPIYELRVYHACEGKLGALIERFRDHTIALFTKHGLKTIEFWTPTDEPQSGNVLIYVIEHPSRAAALENWKSLQADTEWHAVKAASIVNGELVERIDSTFLHTVPMPLS